jgi:hypothetical protein
VDATRSGVTAVICAGVVVVAEAVIGHGLDRVGLVVADLCGAVDVLPRGWRASCHAVSCSFVTGFWSVAEETI